MNSELTKWGNRVIKDSTPILQKYKLDFYPFQAQFKIKSEILIVGLNPASDGYDGTKELHKENYKVELSIDKIFEGNKAYNDNHNEWRIFQNLKKIDFFKNHGDDFNYMNYVFFPTPRFNDIKNIKDFDIINICKSLTLDLIKIVKPKIIIVLGTSTGIDIIAKNTKTILNGYKKRLIVQGEIEGIKAYGIPHPSYNNFQEENDEISKVLYDLNAGNQITSYNLIKPTKENKTSSISKNKIFNILELNKNFQEYNFLFDEFQNKKHLFKSVIKDNNNDEIDFRIDTKKGYFAFRSKNKINNSFYELKSKEKYKSLFFENADIEKDNWLVYKMFNKYNNIQSIEKQISNDVIKILSSFK
ncbi:hypothetical protein [Empedobacter falsenii]|uniref:Uracil-DNA glycosylase-like domain-containing protein n=1 Tax=Empedobacter falsenii TaxID=343874 RepID=A0AAW7DKL2_9FLAO|nr:hypothetical protein [Empedobacter falsenii]MDM1551632.1 hypothetical protein [Empedobacter falsenii]